MELFDASVDVAVRANLVAASLHGVQLLRVLRLIVASGGKADRSGLSRGLPAQVGQPFRVETSVWGVALPVLLGKSGQTSLRACRPKQHLLRVPGL